MPAHPQLYADLDRAIPTVREEFEGWLRDLVEIPTVSMDPAHAADIHAGGRAGGGNPARLRRRGRAGRDAGQPRGVRQHGDGPGAPDGGHLQPHGRAARQRAAVGERTLRVPAPGRPLSGTRHDGRQGAGAHRPDGGALRVAAGTAAEFPVHLGAGGGDRQPELRAFRRAEAGRPDLRVRAGVRHHLAVARKARGALRPARHGDHAVEPGNRRQGQPFRAHRRCGAQPHRRTGRADRLLLRGAYGALQHSRILRGRAAPQQRRTDELPGQRFRPGGLPDRARPARPAQRRRARNRAGHLERADLSRFTASAAATRGRASRPSCRTPRRPRSACGWCPTRTPSAFWN